MGVRKPNSNGMVEVKLAEIGEKKIFVDRGDPSSVDFAVGVLTTNGNWNNLDLSGIVASGALAVLLGVNINEDNISRVLSFRKDGDVNAVAIAEIKMQVANVAMYGDLIVSLPQSRIIEYKATSAVWTAINITVRGWWI